MLVSRFHIVAAAIIALQACASTPPAKPVTPPAQTVCVPLAVYTPAQEQEAAAELTALPSTSMLVTFMTDYGAMRAADRACLGRPAP